MVHEKIKERRISRAGKGPLPTYSTGGEAIKTLFPNEKEALFKRRRTVRSKKKGGVGIHRGEGEGQISFLCEGESDKRGGKRYLKAPAIKKKKEMPRGPCFFGGGVQLKNKKKRGTLEVLIEKGKKVAERS